MSSVQRRHCISLAAPSPVHARSVVRVVARVASEVLEKPGWGIHVTVDAVGGDVKGFVPDFQTVITGVLRCGECTSGE